MTDSKDIATMPLPTPGAGPRMLHVAITAIAPSLTNPRKHFDPAKLQELADSIKASGVHQPILVRPLPAHRLEDTLQTARAQKLPAPEYELVAGERRWRACQLAKESQIPVMVRELTDAQALEAQVIENLQREDVTELEEAEGYQILMETCSINADEVALRIGKSRSYVYGRLKILDLCETGRQALREGKLDFSAGLYIARIPNEQLQIKALEEATEPDFQGDRMSAREVQRMVRSEFMLDLKHAKFETEDASLCPNAGSCSACPNRTGANLDLFTDVGSADVCTNPPCYHAKEDAHAAQLRERAQASGAHIITGREAKALIPTAFAGSIDGYVRLDVAADNPLKGKPLRAVVGSVMEQAGITPTLIENPHAKNELIAVVRTEQAAELLKMAGKADAEAKLREAAQADAEAKERHEKKVAADQFEREWRKALAVSTIKAVTGERTSSHIDMLAERMVATHIISTLNKDEATQLAQALDLGKVAPLDALKDYVKDHVQPVNVAAAVLVLRDCAYTPWLYEQYPDRKHNATLMELAEACNIGVNTVKANVQANLRAELTKKAAASPDKSEAPKANLPLTPASHPGKGVGGGKSKNRKDPAAQTGGGGAKLSKAAAAAGIAAALQAADGKTNPGANAPGNEAVPVVADATQAQPPSAGITFASDKTIREKTPAAAGTGESADDGQDSAGTKTGAARKQALTPDELLGNRVVVLPTATGKGQKIYIGDEGTVVAIIGPEAVDVSFPGPKGCKPVRVGFHVTELDMLEPLEAA